MQQVSIGRIVHYRLTEQDAAELEQQRTDKRIRANSHRAGDVVPMLVVRVWPDETRAAGLINGQAFIDGAGSLWVTSVRDGTEPGTWSWPPRV